MKLTVRLLIAGGFVVSSRLVLAQSPVPAVPAGTYIQAKLEITVKTATAEIGDDVMAELTGPVRAADKVVVPRGSRLYGRVETVQAGTRSNEGRIRLVFREIQFPDGRRIPAWITNSFAASSPGNIRYLIYMGAGGAAGALIGGKTGRSAGIIGGTLTGFIIAGNRGVPRIRDLTLKAGQQIRLELGEDLKF
jgi:hypothetical protein